MSITQSLGEVRPICPFDSLDLHQLNKAMITAEAVGCLLDGAVRKPERVSYQDLVTLADSLRAAAQAIDSAATAITPGVRS